MDTLEKIKELYIENVHHSIMESSYIVEKYPCDIVTKTNDNTEKAIITTNNKDRHGHIVETLGGNIKPYMANPVVLFQHGFDPLYGTLPIGKTCSIDAKDTSMVAQWEWASVEMNARVIEVKNQWRGNFLNSTSIGFIPTSVEELPKEEQKNIWFPSLRIKTWELVEFSVVSIPSNREALRKNFTNDIVPFLERMACNHDHLLKMVTELYTLLHVSTNVDTVKNWRENATVPDFTHCKDLQEKNVYLDTCGFSFDEKFIILTKSNENIYALIEFFSEKSLLFPVKVTPSNPSIWEYMATPPPVEDKNFTFTQTELDEIYNTCIHFSH
jgi:hypothetical protein